MFCDKICIADEKHLERGNDVHHADFKENRDIALNQCKERYDEEAFFIKYRVIKFLD